MAKRMCSSIDMYEYLTGKKSPYKFKNLDTSKIFTQKQREFMIEVDKIIEINKEKIKKEGWKVYRGKYWGHIFIR